MGAAQQKEYRFLKFTQFKELSYWDYYTLANRAGIAAHFPLVRLGEVLKQRKGSITTDNATLYKRCKVQLYGNGVILRDEVPGSVIKTKKQQLCKPNDFLVAEIDAKFGGYGIVPAELDGAIVSSHYFLFEVDRAKLRPDFLQLVVKLPQFSKQVKATGSTNYAAIRPFHVLSYQIPLPSLEEQDSLVSDFSAKLSGAVLKDKVGTGYGLEEYLLDALGIQKQDARRRSSGFQLIRFKELDKWGVEYNLGGGKKGILHSTRYPNKRLDTIAEINPRTSMPSGETAVTFLPMECISDTLGEITQYRERPASKGSGYTKFAEGDLLWARITPCMQNGKSVIAHGLRNSFGFGSTEYHVIRKRGEELRLDYLHLLLRTHRVLRDAMSYFTGTAGQQRVPKTYLEELMIPVPPLEVQTEIVAHCALLKEGKRNAGNDAASLRSAAIAEFQQAIFA